MSSHLKDALRGENLTEADRALITQVVGLENITGWEVAHLSREDQLRKYANGDVTAARDLAGESTDSEVLRHIIENEERVTVLLKVIANLSSGSALRIQACEKVLTSTDSYRTRVKALDGLNVRSSVGVSDLLGSTVFEYSESDAIEWSPWVVSAILEYSEAEQMLFLARNRSVRLAIKFLSHFACEESIKYTKAGAVAQEAWVDTLQRKDYKPLNVHEIVKGTEMERVFEEYTVTYYRRNTITGQEVQELLKVAPEVVDAVLARQVSERVVMVSEMDEYTFEYMLAAQKTQLLHFRGRLQPEVAKKALSNPETVRDMVQDSEEALDRKLSTGSIVERAVRAHRMYSGIEASLLGRVLQMSELAELTGVFNSASDELNRLMGITMRAGNRDRSPEWLEEQLTGTEAVQVPDSLVYGFMDTQHRLRETRERGALKKVREQAWRYATSDGMVEDIHERLARLVDNLGAPSKEAQAVIHQHYKNRVHAGAPVDSLRALAKADFEGEWDENLLAFLTKHEPKEVAQSGDLQAFQAVLEQMGTPQEADQAIYWRLNNTWGKAREVTANELLNQVSNLSSFAGQKDIVAPVVLSYMREDGSTESEMVLALKMLDTWQGSLGELKEAVQYL